MAVSERRSHAELLTSAFAALDEPCTGYLSLERLQAAWTALGMSAEDLRRLLTCSACSVQQDGSVEYPKFFKWLCGAEGGAGEPVEVIPYPPARPEKKHTEEELGKFRSKYCAKESILEALGSGDTVLVKGTWLVEWARSGKTLPKRQDLPADAIWDVKEEGRKVSKTRHGAAWMKQDVILAALSYCWATPEHPDPTGEQLRRVAPVVEMFLTYCEQVAIFIDWCSIYQAPRNDEQQASFKRALGNVNLWYVHELVFSLLLTVVPEGVKAYKERGWPSFEFAISSLIKNDNMFLDLAGLPEPPPKCDGFQDILEKLMYACRISRPPPCTPANFRAKLDGLHFTNGADRGFVMKKYISTFEEVMASAEYFELTRLNWDARDGKELAEALPWCSSLGKLDVSSSKISTEGIRHIATALVDCPTVHTLDVENCEMGDAGVQYLVAKLHETSVVNLWIARNGVSDIGVGFLADMLEDKDCKICEISLKGNEVTDAGAARLATALRREGCPLKLLRLNEMASIGAPAAEVLVAVAKESSCLQTLDFRNTSIGDTGKECVQAAMKECPRLKIQF